MRLVEMNRGKANLRVHRELELLSKGSAAPGIEVWARDEGSRLDILGANICGARETPYEGGVFKLEIGIPPEYPLKPPQVKFLTKIYHPNIDSQGRICLDSLGMPPKGAWKPSLNISTLLTSIQALMSSPNADDGLMADITDEFRRTPEIFDRKAKEFTVKYAAPKRSSFQTDENDEATTERKEMEQPSAEGESVQSSERSHAEKLSPVHKRKDPKRSRLRKRARFS